MKRSFTKRLTVFLLSFVMVFTLAPWLGAQKVYAGETSVSTLTNAGTLTIDMSDVSRWYFEDHTVDPAALVSTFMIMEDADIIDADYEVDMDGDTHMWIDINKDGDWDLIVARNESDGLWWLNPWDDVTLTKTDWTRSIPSTTTFDSDLELPAAKQSGAATGTDVYKYYSKVIFKFPTISSGKATLSYIETKWSGSAKKPKVTVRLKGNKLVQGDDFTVTYKKNKSVGKATVTIRGTGWCQGTLTRTFIINPAGTWVNKATSPSKGTVKVTWHKQDKTMNTTRIDGYQIQVATNSTFTKGKVTKTRKGYANTSKIFRDLKAGKTYYVRVRTFKKVDGVTYFSKWSDSKKVTTKK